MIALGLFDGMSGGQIALTELGFPLTKYYSSEVDKFANQQIMLNFPCTVQLGSVTEVDVSQLEPIDLLLGGSPCLAGDTWVATDHGWKQLLRVRPDDKVFDGIEWVSHQGIVSKGVKPCTSLFGVNITPDHLVYLGEDQWEPVEKLTVETHRRASCTAANLAYGKIPPPPGDLGYLPESEPIEVYDILNAGPRSRFTIATNDGLLIVHNCQSFSFAGKRKGLATKCDIEILDLDTYLGLKATGFEFEGQSYLFWEYVRILQDIRKYNPGVKFLLENVKMGKKWEAVLTKAIGCEGIHINSALVCAQNRRRIYWTNIEGIQQPPDRGILLRDILEGEVDEKYYLAGGTMDRLLQEKPSVNPSKAYCVNTKNNTKSGSRSRTMTSVQPQRNTIAAIYDDYNGRMRTDNKTCTLTTNSGSAAPRNGMKVVLTEQYHITCNCGFEFDGPLDTVCLMCGEIQSGYTNPVCVAMRGRNPSDRTTGAPTEQRLGPNTTGKTNCLTTVGKDNLIMGCDYRSDEGFRVRENGKSGTLAARARNDESCGQLAILSHRIRRLTPKECCRLQTVPDWYLWCVSDTQQYKMLGNGWTIAVIVHILSYWWEGYLIQGDSIEKEGSTNA